jgi:rhodanese-related sulfurtransferase
MGRIVGAEWAVWNIAKEVVMAEEAIEIVEVDAAGLSRMITDREALVIDVRETQDYEEEHILGTVLLPLSFMDAELFPVITGSRVVMVCQIGKRSAAAAKQLIKAGIPGVGSLAGGIDAWTEAGLELEGTKHE